MIQYIIETSFTNRSLKKTDVTDNTMQDKYT